MKLFEMSSRLTSDEFNNAISMIEARIYTKGVEPSLFRDDEFDILGKLKNNESIGSFLKFLARKAIPNSTVKRVSGDRGDRDEVYEIIHKGRKVADVQYSPVDSHKVVSITIECPECLRHTPIERDHYL